MSEEFSLFDFVPEKESEKFRRKKSTDWKWSFSDYPKEKNGLKVFSCFACGGGSTMGYKLAGCDVIGCCEIDKKVNDIYVRNHHPKYNFLMDLREFNKKQDEELPGELFHLDILDGSPPCTTFSMIGEREDSWGKKKKFKEGQAEQTLDDLSFVFIETVKKLKPKTVIMENVEGLMLGEAFSYVQRIYAGLKEAGYKVHHWLLKGETMGVPQTRHRVFFVAIREDLHINPFYICMDFDYESVEFGSIKSEKGREFSESAKRGRLYKLLLEACPEDRTLSDIVFRKEGKKSLFQNAIIRDNDILPTIRASHPYDCYRYPEMTKVSVRDIISASSFPKDYNFVNFSAANVSFICGMSVPPVMIKRIVMKLIEQGVYDYKLKEVQKDG